MWKAIKLLGMACLLGTAVLLACLVLLTNESQAGGGVLCVVPPGEPTGPFAACDEVFTEIQAAVDTAVGGEEIWVAAGIYTDIHIRNGLSQIIYVDKDVTLQGGFTPPFDGLPDPAANPTILDAVGVGRVIYLAEATTITINGLHMTGGNATGTYYLEGIGGAIYGMSVTVTLRENYIYQNIASQSGNGQGGGVAFVSSYLTMTDNIITQNVACVSGGSGAGGGAYVSGSTFLIENNEIMNNTALITGTKGNPSSVGVGGGMRIGDSSGSFINNQITGNVGAEYAGYGEGGGLIIGLQETAVPVHILLERNVIRENIGIITGTAGIGGGVSVYQTSIPQFGTEASSIELLHNEIAENVAGYYGQLMTGGGVFINSDSLSSYTAMLAYNNIYSNIASAGAPYGEGGGLIVARANATLQHNRIVSNTAVISGTSGFGGGVIYVTALITQDGDIIQGNTANSDGMGQGGGLLIDDSKVVMTNMVIVDNSATDKGAGIGVAASDMTLLHPTFARNQGSEAIHMSEQSWYADDSPGILTVTNAIVAEQSVGIAVMESQTMTAAGILWHMVPVTVSASISAHVSLAQQITGNPLFAADGYHITAGSAAIQAGVPSGVTLDIDNEGRPSPNPSLGADEYWPFKRYFPVVLKP